MESAEPCTDIHTHRTHVVEPSCILVHRAIRTQDERNSLPPDAFHGLAICQNCFCVDRLKTAVSRQEGVRRDVKEKTQGRGEYERGRKRQEDRKEWRDEKRLGKV